MIARCMSRNGPKPTSQIIAATRIAMAVFVPIVLSHGIQPLRIIPIGRRCCKMNKIRRTDAEHHYRMPVQPIKDLTPSRPRPKFTHGQRVDVADPPAIEVA